jgi:hypothetical protein
MHPSSERAVGDIRGFRPGLGGKLMSLAIPANLNAAAYGDNPSLSALIEFLRTPPPIMVCREEAARLCGMCATTYDKYVRKGLLPRMNATGRVTIEALKRACLRLDGVTEHDGSTHQAESALQEWKRGRP